MSPTVFIALGNIRFRIYPKDHRPAHVHVVAPEANAKIDIRTGECLENDGFDERTVRRIQEYIGSRRELLMEKWHEYEGEKD